MHAPGNTSRRGLFATLLAALAWLFGSRRIPAVPPAVQPQPAYSPVPFLQEAEGVTVCWGAIYSSDFPVEPDARRAR